MRPLVPYQRPRGNFRPIVVLRRKNWSFDQPIFPNQQPSTNGEIIAPANTTSVTITALADGSTSDDSEPRSTPINTSIDTPLTRPSKNPKKARPQRNLRSRLAGSEGRGSLLFLMYMMRGFMTRYTSFFLGAGLISRPIDLPEPDAEYKRQHNRND